ncbi:MULTISPECIES: hypothetical protein [unclassified Streptomyces]|uniref:hypothetical protein n=1 Tax=unclassified Streptomyces TaxID=2593676 RepID=UPI0019042705|nr:hypothetical protein [Streptomyces sp. HSG2]
MKPRPLLTAAALTLTATLLTACGADQSTTDDTPIAGADQSPTPTTESETSTPTPSPENAPDGVDLSLPDDINLLFEWDTPDDQNEAAALEDAANYMRAIYRGVSQRTAAEPAVANYAKDHGIEYARTQIDARLEGGWTATGTKRFSQSATRSAPNGDVVEVTFCSDSTYFYGKEVDTGKVLKTEPSIVDFSHYKIVMIEHPSLEGLWQAAQVFVEPEAEKCR